MVICFKCSPYTKQQLDTLLNIGRYSSYDEAIALSINNQVTLEERPARRAQEMVAQSPSPELLSVTEPTFAGQSTPSVPEIFVLAESSKKKPEVADASPSPWSRGPVPIESWLFGQYNRFLPVKATARGIANMMAADPLGVPIQEATATIASQAKGLGAYLKWIDERYEHKREDLLATAFPVPKEGVEKSIQRFADQFVAATDANGSLLGLPYELGFIAATSDDRLRLTDAGWKFAILPNPILDQDAGAVESGKFSPTETSFLLSHIATNVPREDYAFRTILDALAAEANTPTKLDNHLRQHVQTEKRDGLSDSFLATQRSGVISRMADLGLIEKAWSGIRVTYVTTALGKSYATKTRTKTAGVE